MTKVKKTGIPFKNGKIPCLYMPSDKRRSYKYQIHYIMLPVFKGLNRNYFITSNCMKHFHYVHSQLISTIMYVTVRRYFEELPDIHLYIIYIPQNRSPSSIRKMFSQKARQFSAFKEQLLLILIYHTGRLIKQSFYERL